MKWKQENKYKKDFDTAFRQFIIDHSFPSVGGFICKFGYPDFENLLWRIYRRVDGMYTRVNEEELRQEFIRKNVFHEKLVNQKKIADTENRHVDELKTSKSLRKRLLFVGIKYSRRFANYLIKKSWS